MENDDIFDGLGVEITLKTKEDFLKVKETLTRIGISSRTDEKLWQSCHILHKRGKYAIMHFKEMIVLDGLSSDISDEDLGRRNVIVKLLVEWGLINAVDDEEYKEPMIPLSKLKIISHKEKGVWQLIPKYHIGRK